MVNWGCLFGFGTAGGWTGGESSPDGVQHLELSDADAPLALALKRENVHVTQAYDSMMVRLERGYAVQGHAPLPMDELELRNIDLLAPRNLRPQLNGLAHTLGGAGAGGGIRPSTRRARPVSGPTRGARRRGKTAAW